MYIEEFLSKCSAYYIRISLFSYVSTLKVRLEVKLFLLSLNYVIVIRN